MRRIGLTASDEMSFENVDRRTTDDDGRTTDGRTDDGRTDDGRTDGRIPSYTNTFIYYKLTNEPSAQVS